MRGSRRRHEDRPHGAPAGSGAPVAAPEPDLLALQRSAGNAAVSRLLAREAAVTSLGMRGPTVSDPVGGRLTAGLMADYTTAMQAVYSWFDAAAAEGAMVQSVAELVDMAASQPFTRADGSTAQVRDRVKPSELELGLRERAKTRGVRLLEHRAMSDRAGVELEAGAILRNLGIPTEVKFGGDASKLVISIMGKVTGELTAGQTKFEGELTPGEAKGSVSIPGGKASLEVTGKEIKAEVRAGDLVAVRGSVTKEPGGAVSWKAEIAIGTLDELLTPADVAKVMRGAQETFAGSAGELLHGLGDPDTIAKHGLPLKDAVSEVAENAKKSAAAARSGWSLGLQARGDESGGVSAAVTLTWVF